MQGQNIREYLLQEYNRRKARTGQYSIRSFARFLNMQPATISQILNGKRKVTFATASEILDKLNVPTNVKNALLLSLDEDLPDHIPPLKPLEIDREPPEQLSWWETWAAYAALDLPGLEKTLAGISNKLGIPLEKTSEVMEFLVSSGFVTLVDGAYHREKNSLVMEFGRTPAFDTAIAQNLISLSVEKLKNPAKMSTLQNFMVIIDENDFLEINRRLIEFRESLRLYLARPRPLRDKVYNLNMHLFPIE